MSEAANRHFLLVATPDTKGDRQFNAPRGSLDELRARAGTDQATLAIVARLQPLRRVRSARIRLRPRSSAEQLHAVEGPQFRLRRALEPIYDRLDAILANIRSSQEKERP